MSLPSGELELEPVVGEQYVPPGAVSDEELAALTVPDGLSDLDRAKLYAAGQEVQQRCLVDNLGGLSPAAFAAVAAHLPKVAETLDEEGQVALAEGLAALLRKRQLPNSAVSDNILPLVLLRAINAKLGPAVQEAWLGCFVELAAALDVSNLRSRLVPVVLQLGSGAGGRGVSGSEAPARCLSARLLGALAPVVPQELVEGLLLRPAIELCQDVDAEVRQAMCHQLPALAAALAGSGGAGKAGVPDAQPPGGPAAAASVAAAAAAGAAAVAGATAAAAGSRALSRLLEEAVLLLVDEEVFTRVAAWQIAAELLKRGLVGQAQRREVLTHFLAQCQVPDSHVEVHRSLTANFGTLISRLVADMDGDGDLNTALSCFRAMAWRHDVHTRQNCAAAFLPVLRAATARRFSSHLHDTLLRLASDPEAEVRLALVESPLHEVATVLGQERCVQYLRPSVVALLHDESREVQEALAGQLVPLLEQFNISIPELRDKVFRELARALVEVEAGSGRNWRLQLDLLRGIAELPKYYDKDLLHDQLLPMALKYLAEGPTALAAPAADTVAAIWCCKGCRPQQRTALYGRLVRELAQGRGWRQRVAFVELCSAALRRFSGAFVKAYLLGPCSLLAFDPVPNVQLRVCGMLPALKQTIALPGDLADLGRLNGAMSHLCASSDKDVSEAASQASQSYRQNAVRMPFGSSSPGAVGAAEVAASEREEALKLAWEKELPFDQEMLDRIQADMEAYDKAHRPAPFAALSLPLQTMLSDATISPRSRGKEQLSNGSAKAGKAGGAASNPSPPSSSRLAQGAAVARLQQRRATSDGQSPRAQQVPKGKGLKAARATTDPDASSRPPGQLQQPPPPLPPQHALVKASSGGAPTNPPAAAAAPGSPVAARSPQKQVTPGGASRVGADERRPSLLSQQPRRATSTGAAERQERGERSPSSASPAASRAESRSNSPAHASSCRLSIGEVAGARGGGRACQARREAARSARVPERRATAIGVEAAAQATRAETAEASGSASGSASASSSASASGSAGGSGSGKPPAEQLGKAAAADLDVGEQGVTKTPPGPGNAHAQGEKAGKKFFIGAVRPRK